MSKPIIRDCALTARRRDSGSGWRVGGVCVAYCQSGRSTHRTHQRMPPHQSDGIAWKCGGPPTEGDNGRSSGNHGVIAGEVPVKEKIMSAEQIEAMNMRLDFQGMVLAVVAGSMSPQEAAHAVQVIGKQVVEQLGRDPVSESAEEAVAADLARIIAALQRR